MNNELNLFDQADGDESDQCDGDGKSDNTFGERELLPRLILMVIWIMLVFLEYCIVDTLVSTNLEVGVNGIGENQKN